MDGKGQPSVPEICQHQLCLRKRSLPLNFFVVLRLRCQLRCLVRDMEAVQPEYCPRPVCVVLEVLRMGQHEERLLLLVPDSTSLQPKPVCRHWKENLFQPEIKK